jgi:hypothetical protein
MSNESNKGGSDWVANFDFASLYPKSFSLPEEDKAALKSQIRNQKISDILDDESESDEESL